MRITTEHLILTPLHTGDAADLYRARGDPQTMEFWDWPPDDSVEATARAVASMLDDVAGGTAHYFSLRSRTDYGFVGLCDLSEIKRGCAADIGFMLARDQWGNGLAREAVAALIRHARGLPLRRLLARIHGGNLRSARLLGRLGFAETARAVIEIRPGIMRDCRHFRLDLEA